MPSHRFSAFRFRFASVICFLALSGTTHAKSPNAGSTTDTDEVVYRQLDAQLARGMGRVATRGRPDLVPEPIEASDASVLGGLGATSEEQSQKRVQFEARQQALRAKQLERINAFNSEISKLCGSGPIDITKVGMTVQRFEQCSREIRFGGGLTHLVTAEAQGRTGKLYAFNGVTGQRIYAIDAHITRIVPATAQASQRAALSVGRYPPLLVSPYMVALSGGHVFGFGPSSGQDWTKAAGTDLRTWSQPQHRSIGSEPAPPFMSDAQRSGWRRFARSPACEGTWHQHSLTAMPDDQVLVAGGLCDIPRLGNEPGVFEPHARTAIWDGRARVWVASPDLAQPRIQHTASVLGSRTVMLVGGFDDPLTVLRQNQGALAVGPSQLRHIRALSSVERFHEGKMEHLQPMLRPRAGHAAIVLASGELLVSGGRGSALRAMTQVELWRTDGQWVARAPMLTPRYAHTASLLPDGRVLVAGGIDEQELALNSTEIYDLASNTWAAGPPLPEHLQSHAAMVLSDGAVLLGGGWVLPLPPTAFFYLWRPGAPGWESLGILEQVSLGQPRPSLVQVVPGQVLAFTSSEVYLQAVPVFTAPDAANSSAVVSSSEASTTDLPPFEAKWWSAPKQAEISTAPQLPPPLAPTDQTAPSGLAVGLMGLLALIVMLVLAQSVRDMLRGKVAKTGAELALSAWFKRTLLAVLLLLLMLGYWLWQNKGGGRTSGSAMACAAHHAACLEASTGLLARQWGVPGLSKFSTPQLPCRFVGQWRTQRNRQDVYLITLGPDGRYAMSSPTRSARDESGHWAVQGDYVLWRTTSQQAGVMDTNAIVSHTGTQFELIEMNGTRTNFNRMAELPGGACKP